jgi:hypothetical protein
VDVSGVVSRGIVEILRHWLDVAEFSNAWR